MEPGAATSSCLRMLATSADMEPHGAVMVIELHWKRCFETVEPARPARNATDADVLQLRLAEFVQSDART